MKISSDLFIKVSVKTDKDCGEVWIEGAHDQITKVVKKWGDFNPKMPASKKRKSRIRKSRRLRGIR